MYSKAELSFIFIIFIVLFLICALRLGQVQILQSSYYYEQALNHAQTYIIFKAKRGKIIDYNGKVLADSVQTYNVGVNQRLIREYKHYEEIKTKNR